MWVKNTTIYSFIDKINYFNLHIQKDEKIECTCDDNINIINDAVRLEEHRKIKFVIKDGELNKKYNIEIKNVNTNEQIILTVILVIAKLNISNNLINNRTATGPSYPIKYSIKEIINNNELTNCKVSIKLDKSIKYVDGGIYDDNIITLHGGNGNINLIIPFYEKGSKRPVLDANKGNMKIVKIFIKFYFEHDEILYEQTYEELIYAHSILVSKICNKKENNIIEYENVVQVSDYFCFKNVKLKDVISDGQKYLLNHCEKIKKKDYQLDTINGYGTSMMINIGLCGRGEQIVYKWSTKIMKKYRMIYQDFKRKDICLKDVMNSTIKLSGQNYNYRYNVMGNFVQCKSSVIVNVGQMDIMINKSSLFVKFVGDTVAFQIFISMSHMADIKIANNMSFDIVKYKKTNYGYNIILDYILKYNGKINDNSIDIYFRNTYDHLIKKNYPILIDVNKTKIVKKTSKKNITIGDIIDYEIILIVPPLTKLNNIVIKDVVHKEYMQVLNKDNYFKYSINGFTMHEVDNYYCHCLDYLENKTKDDLYISIKYECIVLDNVELLNRPNVKKYLTSCAYLNQNNIKSNEIVNKIVEPDLYIIKNVNDALGQYDVKIVNINKKENKLESAKAYNIKYIDTLPEQVDIVNVICWNDRCNYKSNKNKIEFYLDELDVNDMVKITVKFKFNNKAVIGQKNNFSIKTSFTSIKGYKDGFNLPLDQYKNLIRTPIGRIYNRSYEDFIILQPKIAHKYENMMDKVKNIINIDKLMGINFKKMEIWVKDLLYIDIKNGNEIDVQDNLIVIHFDDKFVEKSLEIIFYTEMDGNDIEICPTLYLDKKIEYNKICVKNPVILKL